jgi:hypothetical protein
LDTRPEPAGRDNDGTAEYAPADRRRKNLLFEAWPKGLHVEFKLHAPYKTVIEAALRNGRIEKLIIKPELRKKDVICLAERNNSI